MSKTVKTERFMIPNARLSFPSLFKKVAFKGSNGEGNATPKYEATFLIDKNDAATKAKIDKAIQAAMIEAKIKIPSDRRCLRDGDEVEYDGYSGCWAIKAASNKRPTVINRDKTPVVEEDEVFYPGCYVNAIVDIWVYTGDKGPSRVLANLYGVQFVKDGDEFGDGAVDVTDDFDAIEGEEGDAF